MRRHFYDCAKAAKLIMSLCFVVVASNAKAQEDDVDHFGPSTAAKPNLPKSSDPNDESVIRIPKNTSEPEVKEFTSRERQIACSKFNDKLVSVSGEMWRVVKCTRHHIQDADTVFRLSRQGTPVIEVDSRDVAAIPVGPTWESLQHRKARPCSAFNGKYVTYSFVDIYYVERCIKRLIPDYETLLKHRKNGSGRSREILELTDSEFYALKLGRDIDSTIDQEFSKLLDGSAGIDVVPIDEACKGVEGKIVSFYSRIYKIEKCRKREIDSEAFTKKMRNTMPTELRPEQWLSMPDGKPYQP